MRRLALILLALMLLAAVVPVAAQDDEPDDDEGARPFEHPIATLLATYFEVDASAFSDFHEEGLGFGVLVKVYAMASECPGATVEDLVAAYQGETGLGQLFKEYCRPSVFAPGHLKGRGHPHGGPPGQTRGEGEEEGGPPEHAGPKNQ